MDCLAKQGRRGKGHGSIMDNEKLSGKLQPHDALGTRLKRCWRVTRQE